MIQQKILSANGDTMAITTLEEMKRFGVSQGLTYYPTNNELEKETQYYIELGDMAVSFGFTKVAAECYLFPIKNRRLLHFDYSKYEEYGKPYIESIYEKLRQIKSYYGMRVVRKEIKQIELFFEFEERDYHTREGQFAEGKYFELADRILRIDALRANEHLKPLINNQFIAARREYNDFLDKFNHTTISERKSVFGEITIVAEIVDIEHQKVLKLYNTETKEWYLPSCPISDLTNVPTSESLNSFFWESMRITPEKVTLLHEVDGCHYPYKIEKTDAGYSLYYLYELNRVRHEYFGSNYDDEIVTKFQTYLERADYDEPRQLYHYFLINIRSEIYFNWQPITDPKTTELSDYDYRGFLK